MQKVQVILEDEQKTSDIITKYEYAMLIARRARDIMEGELPTIKTGEYNQFSIAKKELEQRKSPLRIKRTLMDGTVIICNPNEMHIRDY